MWRRLAGLVWRKKLDSELETELAHHLDALVSEYESRGLTREDAYAAARRDMGGLTQVREAYHDQRGLPSVEALWRDVRYAARTLSRSPGFAAVAILTLALGIGGNTAVFGVVNAVLLNPLPYPDPDRVVTLATADVGTAPLQAPETGAISGQITNADFYDWDSEAESFDAMAYFAARAVAVVTGDQAEYARAARVSGDFFRVFGVRPVAGRLFDGQDIAPGPPSIAIVSNAFARNHFGEGAQAIDRSIRVANQSLLIVGVVASDFTFPEGTEIWVPLPRPAAASALNRSGQNFRAVGRVKRGVSLDQARSEMTTIAARLERQYPDTNTGRRVVVTRLMDQMVGNVRVMLYVLLAAVLLVLLIACSNLATLLLARATARVQEIHLRMALGASRGRIVRQMLVEGLLLGLMGGALGLAVAFAGKQSLVALIPGSVPRLDEVAIDQRVLIFTMLVSVISSVLLALVPAFQISQVRLENGLRLSGARAVGESGTRRLREVLVVTQLAMAVVLLIAGGLLIRSFVALQSVALGFRPDRVLVVDATVASSDPRQGATLFFRDLLATMSSLPGVTAAGATMAAPGRVDSTGAYWIDHVPEPSERRTGPSNINSIVAPGTFAALGIPLVRGRDFDSRDVHDAPMTAIVNETLASRALPGQDVIGHRIVCSFDSYEPMTIVGVVGDTRQSGPADEPRPECYMPYLQHPYNGATLSLVIRTTGDPMSLAETVRRRARELAPGVPLRFTTLDALTAQNVAQPRFRALLIGAFAAVGLILAAIGVFGVMAYTVRQRTPEIGLRVALGATPGQIRRLLFERGTAMIGVGLASGLFGAALITRYLDSLLFEIPPTDPLTYLSVGALLATASLLALYVPTRRATKVDPLVALRYE
ncbi:MAG: ADOP family duplicated permease [Vicinamibacterales bacterium]